MDRFFDCEDIEEVVSKAKEIEKKLNKKCDEKISALECKLTNFVGTHDQYLDQKDFLSEEASECRKNLNWSVKETYKDVKKWIKKHVDCASEFSSAKMDIMYEFAERKADTFEEIFYYLDEITSMVSDVNNCVL